MGRMFRTRDHRDDEFLMLLPILVFMGAVALAPPEVRDSVEVTAVESDQYTPRHRLTFTTRLDDVGPGTFAVEQEILSAVVPEGVAIEQARLLARLQLDDADAHGDEVSGLAITEVWELDARREGSRIQFTLRAPPPESLGAATARPATRHLLESALVRAELCFSFEAHSIQIADLRTMHDRYTIDAWFQPAKDDLRPLGGATIEDIVKPSRLEMLGPGSDVRR
jgi:hypothetical protein